MPSPSRLRALGTSLAAAILAAVPALAAPEPRAVLADDAASTLFALDGDDRDRSSAERVAVDGRPFGTALAVSAPDGVENPWGVQISHALNEPIAAGDTLLATFTLRCTESMTGEGRVQFDFEENGEPYDKSVSQVAYVPADWKTFQIPFSAGKAYPAGGSHAAFQLGFGRQTVEFGPFTLENFGPGVAVADLPRTRQTYPGMEEDAPWRAEAAGRIEALRKGDLAVTVLDTDGAPVEGATVRVRMTRHAFPFGSAVTSELLNGEGPDAETYRGHVDRLFNEVVFENDLKWNPYNQATPEALEEALAWLDARGKAVRGHTLVWPSWMYMPAEIETLKDDPDALRATIAERVRSTASRWAGRLVDWDVVNETYTNHQVQDVLGEGCVADWFRIAGEADPDANLYINDYAILTAGEQETPHQNGYFDQIQRLIDAGAPLGGIGLQGHFSAQLTGPETLWKVLDRFASFGLPIKVTEFDLTSNDPQLQADYLRDFYTAMFAHEAVEGVLMWGFWEGRHWRPEAALFDAAWNPRPHAAAYERLVLHDWWTDETATTDADGHARVRGFLGEHDVTVSANGETASAAATVSHDGSELTVRLP